MAFTPINVGAAPNDGTGDTRRAGGIKINANFVDAQAQLNGKQAFHANLAALAALAGSADTVPFFTGPTNLDLTPLTNFARTLIAATTAAAARAVLGVSAGGGGGGGSGYARVYGETPAGAVNGSNVTFTAAEEFVPGSVAVFVNGLRQKPTTHYTTPTGTTVVFADAPLTGDLLLIDYDPLSVSPPPPGNAAPLGPDPVFVGPAPFLSS